MMDEVQLAGNISLYPYVVPLLVYEKESSRPKLMKEGFLWECDEIKQRSMNRTKRSINWTNTVSICKQSDKTLIKM